MATICLRIPDRVLQRALEDVLRSHGHRTTPLEKGTGTCDLRILLDPADGGCCPDRPTLLLRPPPGRPADEHPGEALRRILEADAGTAIWQPPLDTRRLLEVLGGAPRHGRMPTDAHPDLHAAPEMWLVLDPVRRRVVWANPAAERHAEAHPDARGEEVGELEGALARILEASDGTAVLDEGPPRRVATWWTDAAGHRVIGILDVPPCAHHRARRADAPLLEIGRMAATVAHEIRNPLASLAGALDLLEDEEEPSERREIVAMARQRLRDMRTLLDDTLRLSRPIDSPTEAVVAQAAVASAAALFRGDPAHANVTLELDLPEEPVDVWSHAEPLRQALTNLLVNAAQAQGGRGRIRVAMASRGRQVVLRILDEGPGVPPSVRPRIFQPFYTTKAQGTGLGLAYVRRVVEAGGGSIVLEDDGAEGGACFRITLPTEARASEA